MKEIAKQDFKLFFDKNERIVIIVASQEYIDEFDLNSTWGSTWASTTNEAFAAVLAWIIKNMEEYTRESVDISRITKNYFSKNWSDSYRESTVKDLARINNCKESYISNAFCIFEK